MSDFGESSLVVDYSVLKRRVGRELAVPDDEADWNNHQRRQVDQVIEDGLRRYYQPPAVDEFGPHVWSFMYPTEKLKTVANQRWYPLPDGFSHLDTAGSITFSNAQQKYNPIRITSDAHLRELEHTSSTTSFPNYCAVRLVQSRGSSPQKWELGFEPTPDAAYDLAYKYYAEPYMVTDDRPYPLGGQAHSQGILLSCLAAAELFELGRRGDWGAMFVEQLKADISHDARRGPGTLGYGGVSRRGGRGDLRNWARDSRWLSTGGVTYLDSSY